MKTIKRAVYKKPTNALEYTKGILGGAITSGIKAGVGIRKFFKTKSKKAWRGQI